MPIDFAVVAAAFEVPVKGQLKEIEAAFERLGKWLTKRLEAAEGLERSTREYPVLRFYNGALTVALDRSQRGALAPPGSPPSIWAPIAEAGRAAVRGLGRIGEAVTEELALPRLTRTLAEMLETIAGAMDRYAVATRWMFDLRVPRRASDLFGVVALGFRAIATSDRQIRDFAGGVAALRNALRSLSSGTAGAGGGGLGEMVAGLRTVGRYLAGALLLLPLGVELIFALVREASLGLKLRLLDLFTGVEATVHELRRGVIDFFYVTLGGLGWDAMNAVVAAKVVTLHNLEVYGEFALLYVRHLTGGVRTFLTELSTLLRYWTQAVPVMVGAIENFDLAGHFGMPFRFTIGDLIDFIAGDEDLRDRVDRWLQAMEIASFIPGSPVNPVFVRGLREILYRQLTPVALPAETGLPPRAPRFPDLYRSFFAPGAPPLASALGDLATSLREGTVDALRGTARGLDHASRHFFAAAGRMARLGSVSRFEALAGRADAFAAAVFGPEASELEGRLARRRPDRLAEAFEGALAGGGFELLGAAIPIYLGEVRRFWGERRRSGPPAPTPTSPHILARRVRAGEVRTPRATLRAAGWRLDDGLRDQLAGRFRELVRQIYWRGEGRLATVVGTGG